MFYDESSVFSNAITFCRTSILIMHSWTDYQLRHYLTFFAFSKLKYFLLRLRQWSLDWALHNLSLCLPKFSSFLVVSRSNPTSPDLSIVNVFLRLIRFFTEHLELKLFWVCFHGIDFKPVQTFTNIMFQTLQYCLQICSTRLQNIIVCKFANVRLFYDKEQVVYNYIE